MIHVIGDSHASYFYDRNSDGIKPPGDLCPSPNLPFCVHHLGPWYAYCLPRNAFKVADSIKQDIKPGDEVMLVFGEIDCRIQLTKHPVDIAVDRYVDAAIGIRAAFPGVKFGFFGPMASCADKLKTGCWFDTVGTCKERNKVTYEFNSLLEARANRHEFFFVTIFYGLFDANGESKCEFWHDQVHLSIQKTYDLLEAAWLKYRGKPLVP